MYSGRGKEFIKRFKRKFAPIKTDKTDPLSVLVVMNMLLTGFDAPVEQVLYFTLSAGYRALAIDKSEGSGSHENGLNIVMHGLALAAKFKF